MAESTRLRQILHLTATLLASTALFVVFANPIGAEGGEIRLKDDRTAEILVAQGATSISEGPPSGGTGPVYSCGYYWFGYGYWHAPVEHWHELVEGDLYYMLCRLERGVGAVTFARWVNFDPGDPSDGEGITDEQLRDWIGQNLLTVDAVTPVLSPATDQITGLETWFWPGESTATQSRQASAGALSVIVEARFLNMEFDLGEPGADRLVCEDFVEWSPGEAESPCTHTYLHESPAGGFDLVSTTNWRFYWQDAGAAGFVYYADASPSAAGPVPVRDLEAVISAGG